MTIQEKNKLICEFLGGEVYEIWKVQDYTTWAWKGQVSLEFRKKFWKFVKDDIQQRILVDHTLFHKDWSWLMIAAEKAYNEMNPYVTTREWFRVALSSFDINQVYEATIQAIEIIKSRRKL